MKKCLISLFFIFINVNLMAQIFSSGYIVTTNNDTIRGFILDKKDADMLSKIDFKLELDGNVPKSYFVDDLFEFGFDYGRIFEKKDYYEGLNDTIFLFAKRVLTGKINLFVSNFSGSKNPVLFIESNYLNKTTHFKLPKKEIFTRSNGTKYAFEDSKHIGLLNYYTSDAPKDISYINKKNLSLKDYFHVIDSYNDYFSKEIPNYFYTERKTIKHEFSIGMPFYYGITDRDFKSVFRFSYYRNKSFPERSQSMSSMQGVSYQFVRYNDAWGNRPNIQVLSLIPLCLKIHSSYGTIRPYGYCGFGLCFIRMPYYSAKSKEINYDVVYCPTMNLGVGAQLKLGSKYINLELTPSLLMQNVFINVGVSL